MTATLPRHPLTGHPGSDALQSIIGLVRNRMGISFDRAWNQILPANRDLLREQTARVGVDSLGRLLNRAEFATGLPPVTVTERIADEVALLTNRYAPHLNGSPTATQWEVLWRAAESLAGYVVRKEFGDGSAALLIQNRQETVPAGDWKSAMKRSGEVLEMLEERLTAKPDRGNLHMHPAALRGQFKRAVRELQARGLSLAQSFERLKQDEPLFWTRFVLEYDGQ